MNQKTHDSKMVCAAITAMLILVGVMYAAVPASGSSGSIPVVEWKEDGNYTIDLNSALPNGWHDFRIVGLENITYTLNGSIIRLSAPENWNGMEMGDVIYNITHGIIIPFYIGGEEEKSVYVDFVVDAVNDPPTVNTPVINTEFDEDTNESIDLQNYFSDVDSVLSFGAQSSGNITASVIGSTLTLIPAPNWHGKESMMVFATDGEYTVQATLACTVDAVPDFAVEGNDIIVPMLEDHTVDIDLTDYISPGWASISIESSTPEISWTLDGSILRITPAHNWNGMYDMNVSVEYYSIGDPQPPSIEAVKDIDFGISIDVKAVDDPPYIALTSMNDIWMSEDSQKSIDLNSVFADPDTPVLTYTVSSDNQSMKAVVDSNGTLMLIPAHNWYGTANITVLAFDGVYSVPLVIHIHVLNAPDIAMYEDTPMTFDLSSYLHTGMIGMDTKVIDGEISVIPDIANDTLFIDPFSNWNGYSKVEITAYYWSGPVAFSGNPSVAPSYIRYLHPVTEIAEINVLPVNDPPVITGNPEITAAEDTNSTLDLSDYFSDVDSNLAYTASSDGNLSAQVKGSELIMHPAANWNGNDTVKVTATDGEYSVSLSIPVNIIPVDDPPVLLATKSTGVYMNEDSSYSIALGSMFYDVDSTLQYEFSAPQYLNCTVTDGKLVIRPADNWNGDAVLNITATDGEYNVSAEVPIHVLPVDDAPTAAVTDMSLKGTEGRVLSVNLADYFSDVDSELSYSYTGGAHLVVSIDSSGYATIEPADNWSGSTHLNFTASDGTYTARIPVTLFISAVNHAPEADNSSAVLDMHRGKSYTIDLAKYFLDPDGDSLTYTVIADSGVRVSVNGSEATVTVLKSANGDEKITIIASDGETNTSMDMHLVSMPLPVESQNPPPEYPTTTEESSGTAISPTMAYGAMIASIAMAMAALGYALLYLKPKSFRKKQETL